MRRYSVDRRINYPPAPLVRLGPPLWRDAFKCTGRADFDLFRSVARQQVALVEPERFVEHAQIARWLIKRCDVTVVVKQNFAHSVTNYQD